MTGKSEKNINPVSGIYILDPSGIPLFARYYRGQLGKTDLTLLGGFFSAIEIFVKTSLHGLLSDIGMSDSRFYFDRTTNGYITILIVDQAEEELIDSQLFSAIQYLKKTINRCFDAMISVSSEGPIRVEDMLDSLGSTIDSFVVETSFEYIGSEEVDDNFYSSVAKGQSISNDILGELIKRIQKS